MFDSLVCLKQNLISILKGVCFKRVLLYKLIQIKFTHVRGIHTQMKDEKTFEDLGMDVIDWSSQMFLK